MLVRRASRRRALIGLVAVIGIAPWVTAAQQGPFFGFNSRYRLEPNVAYDGRFTFVRAQYARYGGWAAD